MAAPVEDRSCTSGYLMCRHRRYGCEWSAVYRTFALEAAALAARDQHEAGCRHRPPRAIGRFRQGPERGSPPAGRARGERSAGRHFPGNRSAKADTRMWLARRPARRALHHHRWSAPRVYREEAR